MEKTDSSKRTIKVIDEDGTLCESTYPKRANGLVKNGRARFIDENKICLLCPPKKYILEEKKVNNKEKNLDLNYIMEKIDDIIAQGKEINNICLEIIKNPASSNSGNVLEKIQVEREKTNRELIGLLKKIYADINGNKENDQYEKIIDILSENLRMAIDVENEEIAETITSNLMSMANQLAAYMTKANENIMTNKNI